MDLWISWKPKTNKALVITQLSNYQYQSLIHRGATKIKQVTELLSGKKKFLRKKAVLRNKVVYCKFIYW